MKIKNKLTLYFTVIVSSLFALLIATVYWITKSDREERFYIRLENKALTSLRLLIDVEEMDSVLFKTIEKNTINELFEEKIVVFNANRQIIYENYETSIPVYSHKFLDEINVNHSIRKTENQLQTIGIIHFFKDKKYLVVVSALDKYGLETQNNLLKVSLLVFLISVVFTFFAGRYYTAKVFVPMLRIIDKVKKITGYSLHLRLTFENNGDEIANLSHTFNQMLDRLEKAFEMQQSFISNASHELRTPLTAITGQLEVLLMKERTSDEYKMVLNSLLDDVKQLNSITNGLLHLAKSEMDISKIDIKPFRIDELVFQAQHEVMNRNPKHHVVYNIDLVIENENQLIYNINDQLMLIAFINILENACKYSNDNTVYINLYIEKNALLVVFKDNGIGISAQEKELVFEPFFRAGNSTSVRGSGVGLSIVKRILDIHSVGYQINSEINQGTSFIIQFTKK